jgi:hypothetical protein
MQAGSGEDAVDDLTAGMQAHGAEVEDVDVNLEDFGKADERENL